MSCNFIYLLFLLHLLLLTSGQRLLVDKEGTYHYVLDDGSETLVPTCIRTKENLTKCTEKEQPLIAVETENSGIANVYRSWVYNTFGWRYLYPNPNPIIILENGYWTFDTKYYGVDIKKHKHYKYNSLDDIIEDIERNTRKRENKVDPIDEVIEELNRLTKEREKKDTRIGKFDKIVKNAQEKSKQKNDASDEHDGDDHGSEKNLHKIPTVVPLLAEKCIPDNNVLCTKDQVETFRKHLRKLQTQKYRAKTENTDSEENQTDDENEKYDSKISTDVPNNKNIDVHSTQYAMMIGKTVVDQLRMITTIQCPLNVEKLVVEVYQTIENGTPKLKAHINLDLDDSKENTASARFSNNYEHSYYRKAGKQHYQPDNYKVKVHFTS